MSKIEWTEKTWNPTTDRLEIPLRRKKPTMWFVNSTSDLFHPTIPFEFIDRVHAVMALASQHTFQVLTKRPDRMAEYMASRRSLFEDGYTSKLADAFSELLERGIIKSWPLQVTWPLPNVWLGTSVENQATADERVREYPSLAKEAQAGGAV